MVQKVWGSACDGALSERIEYGDESSGEPIESWRRYEYHCLELMRVDERYDSDSSGTISPSDAWRTLEISTHRPGLLGSLLGLRFAAGSRSHEAMGEPRGNGGARKAMVEPQGDGGATR